MSNRNIIVKSLFGIFIVLLILSAVYHKEWLNRRAKENHEIFYNTSIDGKLIEIKQGKEFVLFNVDNNDESYSFMPENTSLFVKEAKIRDRIVKPFKSDSLWIVKQDTTYVFTHRKLR